MKIEEKYLSETNNKSEWFNIRNNAIKNKKIMNFVRKVNKGLDWDIWQVGAFILELMEDANMHKELEKVEKIFDKHLSI